MQIIVLTVLSLLAFAGNSILNRMALANELISPEAFVGIRLASGAVFLGILMMVRARNFSWFRKGSLMGTGSLAVYAIAFSFAYLNIDTGLGALLLFGVVQMTLFVAALRRGAETIGLLRWIGTGLAFLGLCLLLAPGAAAPPLWAVGAMILSAVAWGFYTLVGRGAKDPLANTAANFVFAAPLGLLVWLAVPSTMNTTAPGTALAMMSGILTSALGYTIWYSVLPRLKTTTAALVQLAVPLIAAAAGLLFLSEAITFVFALSATLIIAGIAISLKN